MSKYRPRSILVFLAILHFNFYFPISHKFCFRIPPMTHFNAPLYEILHVDQFRICFNCFSGFVVWITCSYFFIRFISTFSFCTLSSIYLNLSSYSFWENSKLSFRSFMSLLRLSWRWFAYEIFPNINVRMDYPCLWNISWFFSTIDASCSFNILRHFKTVFATNLNVYVIHCSFYFIQDTSAAINDVRI